MRFRRIWFLKYLLFNFKFIFLSWQVLQQLILIGRLILDALGQWFSLIDSAGYVCRKLSKNWVRFSFGSRNILIGTRRSLRVLLVSVFHGSEDLIEPSEIVCNGTRRCIWHYSASQRFQTCLFILKFTFLRRICRAEKIRRGNRKFNGFLVFENR